MKNYVIKLGRSKYSLKEINIPFKHNNIDVEVLSNDPTKYDDIDELNVNTYPVFDFISKQKSQINILIFQMMKDYSKYVIVMKMIKKITF